MSFKVTRVGYRNFRSMGEFVLEPGPRLTILVGPNAAGKTNCVEGLQILTAGASFRHASPSELVRQGSDAGQIRMHVESDKRTLDVAYDVFPSKKLLSINGKRRPNPEGRGILPSILFYPDELLVVKGGAQGRRELVDAFGVQLNKGYAKIASDYKRALIQRNSLLRDAARCCCAPEPAMFEAWTEAMVQAGAMLYLYRSALVQRLAPHVERAYADLANGERAAVSYASAYMGAARLGEAAPVSAPAEEMMNCTRPFSSLPTRGEVQGRLREALAAVHADELRRCQTLAGPHLDDLDFLIEGRPARNFGSQGQQRTLVLAVKLAQVDLVRELQGQYPLFLLDDVMSELDTHRRSRLFDLIQGGMQTIVTTTNLEYFRTEELAEAKVVQLDGRL